MNDTRHRATLLQEATALVDHKRLRTRWAYSPQDSAAVLTGALQLEDRISYVDHESQDTTTRSTQLDASSWQESNGRDPLCDEKAPVGHILDMHSYTTVACVQSLPIELLVIIFEFVVEPHKSHYGHQLRSLTGTCRMWREVAFSTPTLWTTIYLHWSTLSRPSPRRPRAALVEAQLKWSANRPIDVFVHVEDSSEITGYASEPWKLLLRSSSRWKTATIVVDGGYCTDEMLGHRFDFQWPLLESLKLRVGPTCANSKSLLEMFNDAPRLRYLQVLSRSPWLRRIIFGPTWTLTTLSLLGFTIGSCLQLILLNSATLTVLEVADIPTNKAATTNASPPRICLPALTTLRLEAGRAYRYLCPRLRVPSLQGLTLFKPRANFNDEPVLDMIEHSSASLVHLGVYDASAAPQRAILHLMAGLPDVVSLTLNARRDRRHLDKAFFLALTPSEDNPNCILPRLLHFSLSVSKVDEPEPMLHEELEQTFYDLRREAKVVGGHTYPALTTRTLNLLRNVSVRQVMKDRVFYDVYTDALYTARLLIGMKTEKIRSFGGDGIQCKDGVAQRGRW
ncbi:hypothetical protein K525DRAFT_201641 [Schizophyllum commune Loenen D]|nr:hypothetical protein K525DRAFT_201641 [Schizophyllum commune Loenen D]